MSSLIVLPYSLSAAEKLLMALSCSKNCYSGFRFSVLYSDLQELLGIAEMRGNVVTQSELLLVVQDLVVEDPDL